MHGVRLQNGSGQKSQTSYSYVYNMWLSERKPA